MGAPPYTPGEAIDSDDSGVIQLGKQDSDNTLQIISTEPTPSLTSIALGQVTGWSVIDKFGKNEDVDTVFETVSLGGSTGGLTSAETVDIVSADANDTLAGTGAQKIVMQGLDASYNEIEEEVELDGLTPVTTTKTFLRFYRAKVIQVGSGATATNIGTITLTASVTTTITTSILAGEGQTQTASFTIPLGKTGYFDIVFIATDTSNIITGQLQVKPFGQGWQTKHEVMFTAGHVTHNMSGSGAIPEKSDIRWIAKANNPNNRVSAGFKILMEED